MLGRRGRLGPSLFSVPMARFGSRTVGSNWIKRGAGAAGGKPTNQGTQMDLA
jgi:hypothetical protein